jgi:hypothetical protein
LYCCLVWSADPLTIEATTLDGRTLSGRLQSLSAATLVLDRDGNAHAIPLADLLEVRNPAAAQPESPGDGVQIVTLQDGSRLRCRSFHASGQTLTLQHAEWGALEVPAAQVRTVLLAAEDPALSSAWKQLTERPARKDLVVIRKGDVLDHLDGVVGAIDDNTVNFLLDGDQIAIKRERIYGIVYSKKDQPGAKDALRVEFSSGDLLLVRQAHWTDGQWQLTRPGFPAFSAAPASVQRIDYSQGKVQYLSATEPRDVKYTPAFDYVFEYQRDRHLFGGPLRLGGRTYSRGLAIHSKTVLRYRLGGEFRRLTAVMGIDPEVKFDPRRPETRAQVRLEIRGDGRLLFGADVFAGDPPQNLDLSVEGVSDLEILVDFGDDSDIGDRIHLGEAKVIK